MRIKLVRVSFWFTTIIPTIGFLAVAPLVGYLGYDYFGVIGDSQERSDFALTCFAILSIIGGLVAGVFTTVYTQKAGLVVGRLKKQSIELEDALVKSGGKPIDLREEYYSFIRAGETPNNKILISINIAQGKKDFNICLIDMQRKDALAYFPDERFVMNNPYSTEYGIPGFECDPAQASHLEFMQSLLGRLYENRGQDRRHQIYSSFPWDIEPNPQHTHIRTINPDSDEGRTYLETLRQDVVYSGPNFELTPHYVIITTNIFVPEKTTFVIPVGHTEADVEEKSYTSATTTNIHLKQLEYPVLSGTNDQGNALSVYVDVLPTDGRSDEHTKLMMLVFFMNESSYKIHGKPALKPSTVSADSPPPA